MQNYLRTNKGMTTNKLIQLLKHGKAGMRELVQEELRVIHEDIYKLVIGAHESGEAQVNIIKGMETPQLLKDRGVVENNLFDYLRANQNCEQNACRELLNNLDSWLHGDLNSQYAIMKDQPGYIPRNVYVLLKDRVSNAATVRDSIMYSPFYHRVQGALSRHFNQGDLVYGLATRRGGAIGDGSLRGTGVEIVSSNGLLSRGSPIIDRYNNEISKRVWDELQALVSKAPVDPIQPSGVSFTTALIDGHALFDTSKKTLREQMDDLVKRAFEKLNIALSDTDKSKGLWEVYQEEVTKQGSKFNLARVYQRAFEISTGSKEELIELYKDFRLFGSSNSSHEAGIQRFGFHHFIPTELWKKGSKLGIELVLASPNRKLHFVLDGLTIEDVVRKTGKGVAGTARGAGQSITASELRYLYRNREVPGFDDKIFFYKDGKVVPAPWVENPSLWSTYEPSWLQLRYLDDIISL